MADPKPENNDTAAGGEWLSPTEANAAIDLLEAVSDACALRRDHTVSHEVGVHIRSMTPRLRAYVKRCGGARLSILKLGLDVALAASKPRQ